MLVSRHGAALFIKFAIIFLIGCLIILFSAAAIANRITGNDDDDSRMLVHSSVNRA